MRCSGSWKDKRNSQGFSLSTVKPLLNTLSWTSQLCKEVNFLLPQNEPLTYPTTGGSPMVVRPVIHKTVTPAKHPFMCLSTRCHRYTSGSQAPHLLSRWQSRVAAQPKGRHWPCLCKTRHLGQKACLGESDDIFMDGYSPGESPKGPRISLLIFFFIKRQNQLILFGLCVTYKIYTLARVWKEIYQMAKSDYA